MCSPLSHSVNFDIAISKFVLFLDTLLQLIFDEVPICYKLHTHMCVKPIYDAFVSIKCSYVYFWFVDKSS